MKKPYQANIIRVTLDLLGDLLGLPEGHKAVDVLYEPSDRSQRTFRVIVEGPGCHRVPEGNEIPWSSLVEIHERAERAKQNS
jgi:hypothetical protein